MNQISFVETRARRKDPESSKIAAKNAAGGKAGELRRRIANGLQMRAICGFEGLTAKEMAELLHEDFYAVSRRLSETANIRKTGVMRDGGMVWEYASC
jgi:hypothetical protein